MKRLDWVFRFTVSELLTAAQAKVKYHEEREMFYDEEYAKALNALKEFGMQQREVQVTGGARVETVIDPQRQRLVDEMFTKRKKHQGYVEDYARFVRAFEVAPDKTGAFDLDVEDVKYFGL